MADLASPAPAADGAPPASTAPASTAPARLLDVPFAVTVVLAVAAALIAHTVAVRVLEGVPHVMDEIAYVLQARTLALGKLATPPQLPRAAFNLWFVEDRFARFSIFPPGWPLVLAAAMRAGLEHWVNPALHAVTTVLVGLSARALGGRRAQVLAAGLFAFSPQALLLASSLMSHGVVAVGSGLVLLACVRYASRSASRGLLAAAGVALGLTAATRPLCAVALLVGVVGVTLRYRQDARRWIWALVPMAGVVGLLLAYNRALTGDATMFPQSLYFNEHLPPVNLPVFNYHPGCNDLGLGQGHGCDWGIRGGYHDLRNALSNTGDNLTAWTLLAGGGPLVYLAAAWAFRRGRDRLVAGLLLVPVLAAVGLYALYWYAGTCYGARFYHAALAPLLVLAALGLRRFRAPVLAGALAVWLGWNAFAFQHALGELRGYWGTDARFERVARSWSHGDALVLVGFTREPYEQHPLFWTATQQGEDDWLPSIRALAALATNTPDLDGRVVFAKFHPGLVEDLRARFPGRDVWLYVATPDPARDQLVPYDRAAQLLDEPLAYPVDNFDGYLVDGQDNRPRELRRRGR